MEAGGAHHTLQDLQFVQSSSKRDLMEEEAVYMILNSTDHPRAKLESVPVKLGQQDQVNYAVPAESIIKKNTQKRIERRELRLHKPLRYVHIFEHYPLWMLSLLNAIVLLVRIPHLDGWNALRTFIQDNLDHGGSVTLYNNLTSRIGRRKFRFGNQDSEETSEV